MSIRQRVLNAIAATAFGHLVTIVGQIALAPLFLSKWGVTAYGEWLMLSAIPAYLAVADVGIGSAAGNEMAMRAGSGDHEGAKRTFEGALLIAAAAFLFCAGVGSMAAFLTLEHGALNLSELPRREAAGVLIVLSLYVGFSFVGNVTTNGFRSYERNALGLMTSNVGRFAEILATGCALWIDAGPVTIASLMLATNIATALLRFALLQRVCPRLFGLRFVADLGLLRRLLRPALGFVAIPAGNAVLLQGSILVIAQVLGGSAVALFSTTRTLTRLPVQLANMLNASIWPEMSTAYGAGNQGLLRRLHRASVAISLATSAALVVGLSGFGPEIFRLWLNQTIDYDRGVSTSLLLAALVSAVWNTSSIVLAATNRHLTFGMLFLGLGALCIAISIPLMQRFGLIGMCYSLLAFELALGAFVVSRALRVSGDSVREFVLAIAVALPRRIDRVVRSWNFRGRNP